MYNKFHLLVDDLVLIDQSNFIVIELTFPPHHLRTSEIKELTSVSLHFKTIFRGIPTKKDDKPQTNYFVFLLIFNEKKLFVLKRDI
jgi:hypothetical protein